MRGVIVHVDLERSFGFVRPAHGGPDIYLHARSVENAGPWDCRAIGDLVEFEADAGRVRRAWVLKIA